MSVETDTHRRDAESGKTCRLRPIEHLRLADYRRPQIRHNRGPGWRATWYLVNALVFQGALLGLLPSRAKAWLLRRFGARVGRGLVCKPRVNIKYPWFLEIGDHVWLGEGVWIDNHCRVAIGSNVCISQGCYLGTGNHDWRDPQFTFFCRPITIGDGVWLTAFQKLHPGTDVPAHHAVIGG
ncbi:MAG: colanic acid biosynthesis acetyltransferase WcaF [Alphaproteobacteria bacterium]